MEPETVIPPAVPTITLALPPLALACAVPFPSANAPLPAAPFPAVAVMLPATEMSPVPLRDTFAAPPMALAVGLLDSNAVAFADPALPPKAVREPPTVMVVPETNIPALPPLAFAPPELDTFPPNPPVAVTEPLMETG